MATINRLLVAVALIAFSIGLQARQLDWLASPYTYVADSESLRDVLINFGANYDAAVNVSDKVNDQISGRFESQRPQAFLEQLAALYNLVWYYDGTILYVTKSSEMESRLFRLETIAASELRKALKLAGIWDERFNWREGDSGFVFVSGPPRYINLIDQTLSALEQQAALKSERTGGLAVEIFPLKYAVAQDREIQYRGEKVSAPGLASVLSRVLSGANLILEPASTEAESKDGQGASVAPVAARVVVEADVSLNAIIVRDTPERMPMYRRLIKALDKPSARIEVGLSIVDINADDVSQLGVDWQLGFNLGEDKSIDVVTTLDSSLARPATATAATTGVSSLVDQKGLDYLKAKVTLLESEGSAQVVSRPTLLTQENTQAVIDHNETYYVKVSSERSADLKAITYGTMLRMTPRVVQLGDQPEISLSLHIEDGNQKPNSTGVDGIPTISRTIVDTIARVGHGQSLLIGGIYRDELSETLRKVPLLGDIPLLGALFRSKADTLRRSVRLFIIEPRLIDDGIGRYVTLGHNIDMRQGLMSIDELSNQSSSLKKLLGVAQCQSLESAQAAQLVFKEKQESSYLKPCENQQGQGWRIHVAECPPNAAYCQQVED